MERGFWSRKLKFIYIFCEWYTEEYYFTHIKTLYRNNPVLIKWIRNLKRWGEFKNIRKLNETIISRVKKDKIKWIKVEQWIYAVFDLDIFTKKEVDDLYNWIDERITLIPSNMTFEYWILSHFQKYSLWKWKSKYFWLIKKHLDKIGFKLKNTKFTWNNDFNWLENIEQIKSAVENVKKVNSSHWNLKSRDPYSEVYKIIEFLES